MLWVLLTCLMLISGIIIFLSIYPYKPHKGVYIPWLIACFVASLFVTWGLSPKLTDWDNRAKREACEELGQQFYYDVNKNICALNVDITDLNLDITIDTIEVDVNGG